MQITTSLRRTAALAGLTAVAAAAPAAVSSAATYDNARVIKPGATLPLDFAGYREPANNKLAANHRIVAVDATIGRDEKASRIVTVPKGFRIITLGIAGSEIGGRTENDYVGRRSVRLTLFVDRNEVAAGQSADGTIYVLARRA
jgi:hypothetical protein